MSLIQGLTLPLRSCEQLPGKRNCRRCIGDLLLQTASCLLVRRQTNFQFLPFFYTGQCLQFLPFGVHLGEAFRPDFRLILQSLFDDAVILRLEQHLHDFLALAGIRQQQAAKFSLWQQDDLPELIPAETENSLHFSSDPLRFFGQHCGFFAVRIEPEQRGALADLRESSAPFAGNLLFRGSPDPVQFLSKRKIEGHFRAIRFCRVVAAHILAAAHFSACFPIKRIAHRIKQGSFPRTGRPMDQKEAVSSQFGKIDHLLTRIGPERPNVQLYRSHTASPPVRAVSSKNATIVSRCFALSIFCVDHSAKDSNSSSPDRERWSGRSPGVSCKASC